MSGVNLDDIDFGALYRRHKQQAGRRAKPASSWDARAQTLYDQPLESAYTDAFISRMDFSDARTLLDVGCGAGNIAVQVADRLDAVYGMDYSTGMLDVMRRHAQKRGLGNVHAIHGSWDDSWTDVPVCDIVVASRSTLVDDMADALQKLHDHAARRVYISYLTGGFFIDKHVARLLGHGDRAQPDYLYILGILHGMGLYPRLDYVDVPGRLAGITGFEDLEQRVARALAPLDAGQRHALRQWYDADPARAKRGGAPMRWAFISWETHPDG